MEDIWALLEQYANRISYVGYFIAIGLIVGIIIACVKACKGDCTARY